MTTPLRLRALNKADQPEVLRLFQEVFGGTRSPEWWEWQFLKNPFNRPVVWLAENEQGKLVGHYCLIPVPFWKGGKLEKAGFSIHSMVHPDFQRRGILNKLAEVGETQLSEDAINTGLTFVNQNSFYLYTQKLGWSEMKGTLPVYFAVLDLYDILRKFVKIGGVARALAFLLNPLARVFFSGSWFLKDTGSVKVIERFDDRADALWSEIRKRVSFATDRSAEYLNWRFVANPYRYHIFSLESDGKMLGFVVTRQEQKFGYRFGYIVDLIFDPRLPNVGIRLVKHVFAFLADQGCAMVTALATDRRLGEVLKKSGLKRLPKFLMPHEMHFCCKDRSAANETEKLVDPSGWYLSWSDHDVV